MMGGSRDQIINAVSQAFVDGQSLRTYRQFPNAGSRKSWAAGDASARAVRLALFSLNGEMGIPTVLTAKEWGFYDVLFGGKAFAFQRPYGSYVMENILFKVSYPAEFHAQTAVECAMALHADVKERLDDIDRIVINTHSSAIRIIDKTGPLRNPADRDHCLQYMVAVPLIFGRLTAADYEDDVASDVRIDALRAKITCVEDETYSEAYLDPEKRSIANAIQVFYKDGTSSRRVVVTYPIGHRRRRSEGFPLLIEKFERSLSLRFPDRQRAQILSLMLDHERLSQTSVVDFTDLFAV
jgi:2-methylcitrate dehydratase